MKKKIKKIDDNKKIRGARIVWFCGKCKRDLTEGICHKTKEDSCLYSEKHELKYYLNLPHSGGKREARVLKSITNLNEAQAIVLARKLELLKGRFDIVSAPQIHNGTHEKVVQKSESMLLKNLLAEHLDFLGDHNLPPHLKKNLSPDYLKEISRAYKYFELALENHGLTKESFTIEELNDTVCGYVYDFLLDKEGLNFSDRSFTKHIQFYESFLNWCIDKKGVGKINHFKDIPKRKPVYTPKAISKDNFEKLLASITREKGIQKTANDRRYLYRDWLAFSYRLMLETGRRRTEVANICMEDIYSENSTPIYIKVEDHKTNSILKLKNNARRYAYVPVTEGVQKLIMEAGYEEYLKDKINKYLIAPDITDNRKRRVAEIMSRAWAHYYQQEFPQEKEPLSLGVLRATYLTSMELHTKGETAVVSAHGSGGKFVLTRHYIDPKALAAYKAASGFSVFEDENTRKQKQLEKIRRKEKSKNLGLEM